MRAYLLALMLVTACGGEDAAPLPSDDGLPQADLDLTVTELAGGLAEPIDAAPSPDGGDVYILTVGGGEERISRIAASGGDASEVTSGSPLVEPRGLALSRDGNTIYVADRSGGMDGGGAIFAVPSSGGSATLVPGSEGLQPSAIEVTTGANGEQIYFTGVDESGNPAVFFITPSGGSAFFVAAGAPLKRPEGIAIGPAGEVIVSDRESSGSGDGQVFRVADGMATAIVDRLVAGSPAGTAFLLDGSSILVSSLDEAGGTSQLLVVDAASHDLSVFDQTIGGGKSSAGLHRAHDADVFAFADGASRVFLIR